MSNVITCLVIYFVLFWNVLERLNECCRICLPFRFKLMSWFEFVVQLFPVLFWSTVIMCHGLIFISSLCLFFCYFHSSPVCCWLIAPVYLNSHLLLSLCQFICSVSLSHLPVMCLQLLVPDSSCYFWFVLSCLGLCFVCFFSWFYPVFFLPFVATFLWIYCTWMLTKLACC